MEFEDYYETEEGPYDCEIAGLEFPWVSPLPCSIANIGVFLHRSHLAQICLVLLLTIMVISLFGKIKENYRWFILNQAVWDLVITYHYTCENHASLWTPKGHYNCFYISSDYGTFYKILREFFQISMGDNSYSALLLLSTTRFTALYFMRFYQRLTQKRRIFVLLFVFNFVFVVTLLLGAFFQEAAHARLIQAVNECREVYCKKKKDFNKKGVCINENKMMQCVETDFWSIFHQTSWTVFHYVNTLKAPSCLLISIAASLGIMIKICQQSSFQRKHNKKDFFGSLRIGVVLLSQCLMNTVVLFVEALRNLTEILAMFGFEKEYEQHEEGGFTEEVEKWYDSNSGLGSAESIQMIKQLRVFFEYIVVLALMTGYREAIISFAKWVIRRAKGRYNSTTKVTVLSSTATSAN